MPISDVLRPLPVYPLFSGVRGYVVPSFGENEEEVRSWAKAYEKGYILEFSNMKVFAEMSDSRVQELYLYADGEYRLAGGEGVVVSGSRVDAVRFSPVEDQDGVWWKADPREGMAKFFYSYDLHERAFFPPSAWEVQIRKEMGQFFSESGVPLERDGFMLCMKLKNSTLRIIEWWPDSCRLRDEFGELRIPEFGCLSWQPDGTAAE